jgi:hypothetical protein
MTLRTITRFAAAALLVAVMAAPGRAMPPADFPPGGSSAGGGKPAQKPPAGAKKEPKQGEKTPKPGEKQEPKQGETTPKPGEGAKPGQKSAEDDASDTARKRRAGQKPPEQKPNEKKPGEPKPPEAKPGEPEPDGKKPPEKKQAEKKKPAKQGRSSNAFEARIGTVRRQSGAPNGEIGPPWIRIEITGVGFRSPPQTAAAVTVVPFAPDAPSFPLTIESGRRAGSCGRPPQPWWEVGLAPATAPALHKVKAMTYRAENVPIDVAVIFPAAEGARYIARDRLPKSDIPGGFAPQAVKGAVDLDKDGKADLVFLEFCCGTKDKVFPQCFSTCSAVYRRVKGKWVLLGKASPC